MDDAQVSSMSSVTASDSLGEALASCAPSGVGNGVVTRQAALKVRFGGGNVDIWAEAPVSLFGG